MDIWVKEVVEQVCLAELLEKSRLDSGKRLALISVDNAVEVSLKFYAGYHGLLNDAALEGNSGFFAALEALRSSGKVDDKQAKDTKQFHKTRNDLYHRAKLTTVKEEVIESYIELAKILLDRLFEFSIAKAEWEKQITSTTKSMSGEEEGLREPVEYERKEVDGRQLVHMKTSADLQNTESIMLSVHGFITSYARTPTKEELQGSLMISGRDIPANVLEVRLADLRKTGFMERGQLKLKGKALLRLRKRFFI